MAKEDKEPKQDGKTNEKLVSLVIVVNTAPVTISINENSPLKAAAQKALEQTQNTSRPLEDWEMKRDAQVLDLGEKIKTFGFTSGEELFLSLKAGVGGH